MIQHNLNPNDRLCALEPIKRDAFFSDLIDCYCSLAGLSITAEKIKPIVFGLNYWINGKLSKMYVYQVVLAFEKAIEGEYHTLKQIDAKQILEWLNKTYSTFKTGHTVEYITDVDSTRKSGDKSGNSGVWSTDHGTAMLLRHAFYGSFNPKNGPPLHEIAEGVKNGVNILTGKPIVETKTKQLPIGVSFKWK